MLLACFGDPVDVLGNWGLLEVQMCRTMPTGDYGLFVYFCVANVISEPT